MQVLQKRCMHTEIVRVSFRMPTSSRKRGGKKFTNKVQKINISKIYELASENVDHVFRKKVRKRTHTDWTSC
jgi:hypothetical protein